MKRDAGVVASTPQREDAGAKGDGLEGNIYKGWAIGATRRNPARGLVLTLIVMFTQLVAPMLMVVWANDSASRLGKPVYVWEYGLNPIVVLTKLLGTGLLLLVYVHSDLLLDRLDRESDVLPLLFPEASSEWLFMDALCNACCVFGAAWALPFLLWSSESTPMNIWLDVFGILFVSNLDDYSGTIAFGMGEMDFEEAVVAARQKFHETSPLLSGRSGTAQRSGTESMATRFLHGSFLFTIARIFNLLAGSIAVPSFFCAKFPAGKWHLMHGSVIDVLRNPAIIAVAIALCLSAHIVPVMRFMSRDYDCPRDFFGFVYAVIFRRPDPRKAVI